MDNSSSCLLNNNAILLQNLLQPTWILEIFCLPVTEVDTFSVLSKKRNQFPPIENDFRNNPDSSYHACTLVVSYCSDVHRIRFSDDSSWKSKQANFDSKLRYKRLFVASAEDCDTEPKDTTSHLLPKGIRIRRIVRYYPDRWRIQDVWPAAKQGLLRWGFERQWALNRLAGKIRPAFAVGWQRWNQCQGLLDERK